MGLRIHSNLPVYVVLRNFRLTGAQYATSLERLSTGLRINSAADDPSGYVISALLRSQIAGLTQASENSQNVNNMLATANSAMQEISKLLLDIQKSVIAALGGGLSEDELKAEQASVDAAIQSINSLAQTTRFAGKGLLNGQAALVTSGTVGSF
jgi:flagellin